MPDTDVLADTEILSALDYDPDLPCESKISHGCSKTARWLQICNFCKADIPVCDAQRNYIISGGKEYRDRWVCRFCRHESSKAKGHFWSFVPLKK